MHHTFSEPVILNRMATHKNVLVKVDFRFFLLCAHDNIYPSSHYYLLRSRRFQRRDGNVHTRVSHL